jgi:nucleoside 2-deoxyribosyltransferase
MKLIYVAGPYRAEGWGEVWRNVSRAADLAAELLRAGHGVICPHTMTYGWEMYRLEDSVFLANGLEQLRRCDAVVLVDSSSRPWYSSAGTRQEVAVAVAAGIPVYASVYDLQHERPLNAAHLMLTVGNIDG